MATQLERARAGTVTEAMERVAERETQSPEVVREHVAEGQAVIPNNHAHDALDPMIVDREFSTKVNANNPNSETASNVDFCSMRIDHDARDVADGEMEAIDDDTDIDRSPAAEANLPPVGTHDTSGVADLPDFVDADAVEDAASVGDTEELADD